MAPISLPSPPNNLYSSTQSDLESGNPISIPNNNIDSELPEWKRIGKFVQTVNFGLFGAFISLLVNNPTSATIHPAHYIPYFTFVCLGLASSICLAAFSIIMKGSTTVCFVQKKLMYFNFFFVLLACCFRLQIALPLFAVGLVTVLVLIGLLVILLYLLLNSRCSSSRQTNETGI
ncbi:hypothetical protein KFK09_003636 [Dendrobium nobile]|uniref:Uncharacterized protein n=1 Tax=Dendrobium nobile TaxID=94219 RepID=A0A8T3C1V0_DENNO|nr:hypothetical protein KFK09_003636 [Dendrobium nobile]